jgi:hypothetical protein
MGMAGFKHWFVAFVILAGIVLLAPGSSYASSISLVGNGYIPEPNEEVTVYIRTNTPLFCVAVVGFVVGDATITGAMNESDSGNYGWDPFWTGEPDIDPAGWVNFCGVSWIPDANGIVGYFKFIYHSGEVAVSIIGDAYDSQYQSVPFSETTLSFGQSDPNANMPSGGSQQNPASQSRATNMIAAVVSGVVRTRILQSDPSQEYWRYMHPQSAYNTPSQNAITLAMEASQETSPLVIDANTVITQNTVWNQDVILNGTVYVEGCQLAIMPGVSVYNNGGSGGIVVRNNGVLIANGTNEHRVGFTTTSTSWYDFAIKIESTASPSCSIYNCVIMFALNGVWIDNCRLDNPIEQMTISICGNGISEEGPNLTDIFNNEMILCKPSGIEVYLTDAHDPNNTCSADTNIAIEHNSIIGIYGYAQDYGIAIHGAPDPNKAGYVWMADNLIAGSEFYAVYLAGGAIACDGKFNQGYFDNHCIDNYQSVYGVPWNEWNPKYAAEDEYPFWYRNYGWPFLLDPNSIFVNGGYKTVEETGYLIGQTTFFGVPDVNMADIGVHYNWEGYVNAGVSPLWGDFNADASVDVNDLLFFSEHWLASYAPKYNYAEPNRIDFRDFSRFAKDWKKRVDPIPPDTAPTFDQDPNNLKGDVTVSVDLPDCVYRAVLLLDGKAVAYFGNTQDASSTLLETRKYANGWHKVKLVFMTESNIFLTTPIEICFNNELSLMTRPIGFEVGKDCCIYAISEPNSYTFRFYDVNETLVFAQDCNDGINVKIPASTFNDDSVLFRLQISLASAPQMMAGLNMMEPSLPPECLYERFEPKKFNPKDPKMQDRQILISIGDPTFEIKCAPFWMRGVAAANARGMKVLVLPGEFFTFENLYQCLNLPNIRIWQHSGHGDNEVSWMERKTYITRNREVIWFKDYDQGLFSHLRRDEPTAEPLGPYESERQHSVSQLGAFALNKLIWVQFDTCRSGSSDEFAQAFGILDNTPLTPERVFIGWNSKPSYEIGSSQDKWETAYWLGLSGGSYNLKEAWDAGNTAVGWWFWGWLEVGRYFKVYCNPDDEDLWQTIHFRYSGL